MNRRMAWKNKRAAFLSYKKNINLHCYHETIHLRALICIISTLTARNIGAHVWASLYTVQESLFKDLEMYRIYGPEFASIIVLV